MKKGIKTEYGKALVFVATNAEYIKGELSKLRTAKSIWEELMKKEKGRGISYRSFLTQITALITNKTTIRAYQREVFNESLNMNKEKVSEFSDKENLDKNEVYKKFKSINNEGDID